ncbi:LSM domain, eukaryotic/archaea-type [Dillenia turbinata]|uniref:Sm protein G n=1 Tax=Dillenia turbinata TaxID=194707 RepID=A0AAN8UR38_9MAGN
MDNVVEMNGNEKIDIGMMVIRGNSIVTVKALEPVSKAQDVVADAALQYSPPFLSGYKYMDKKLQSFDLFMNLVVDNIVEVSGNEKIDIGMVVIIGNSVVTIEALELVSKTWQHGFLSTYPISHFPYWPNNTLGPKSSQIYPQSTCLLSPSVHLHIALCPDKSNDTPRPRSRLTPPVPQSLISRFIIIHGQETPE